MVEDQVFKQKKRKPPWIKIDRRVTPLLNRVQKIVKEERLTTVCEEAKCPNLHECWGEHGTATFMILGDVCTRRCRFCSVKTGLPRKLDLGEPNRVGKSVAQLALKHVVITMVDRDDLSDGGARMVVETVHAIRRHAPGCSVELLTSDFMARPRDIESIVETKPEIMSHNLETVRRLTPQVRSRASYDRSLQVLKISHAYDASVVIKSSLMLGLGEQADEVVEAMEDLREVGTTMCNLGQYLQPTATHLPVQKYYHPDEFLALKEKAYALGFVHCESGALVRSSYHAGEDYESFRKKIHPLYKNKSTTRR